jgi:hypothetical protein
LSFSFLVFSGLATKAMVKKLSSTQKQARKEMEVGIIVLVGLEDGFRLKERHICPLVAPIEKFNKSYEPVRKVVLRPSACKNACTK